MEEKQKPQMKESFREKESLDPMLQPSFSSHYYQESPLDELPDNPSNPWQELPHRLVHRMEQKTRSASHYLGSFIKWCVIAVVIGIGSGLVGTLFQLTVLQATRYREGHNVLIYFLPLAGLIIVALYRFSHINREDGTDQLLHAIHTGKRVSSLIAPLIFISTVITHLFGGSAGREGAALQLGGALGIKLGRTIHLNAREMRLMILCGMSGVFSALFGTPLTSTFFAMEISSVGLIYYPGFIPCLFSSLVATGIATRCGVVPVHFALPMIPELSWLSIVQVAGLSLLCALLSILFCVSITHTPRLFARWVRNDYLRIFLGGSVLVILTLLSGTNDYNGMSSETIHRALEGMARPDAFLWKFALTMITLGVGFKGGAIVPAFFIGATFGCTIGGWLGLAPAFGAAVGLIAIFCAAVNCPLASLILSIELFGSEGLILFAVACAISYMLSGYYSLFTSQTIIYSKWRTDFVNIHAK